MRSWLTGLSPDDRVPVPEAASDPEMIALATAEIGQAPTSWAVQAAADIVRQVGDDFAAEKSDFLPTGNEREGCEACLLTTLVGIHRGAPAEEVAAPRGARNHVRLSVRQGIPIGTVVRLVWASHTQVQDALLARIAETVDPSMVVGEVRDLNDILFAYVNSYVRDLMAEYEEEVELWRGRLAAERLSVFTMLVDGERPPVDAERILGLRLQGDHLIAVGWPATGSYVPARDAEIAAFASDVGRRLGASGSLVLQREGGTEFWWTMRSRAPAGASRTVQSVARPAWMNLAIGVPGHGIEGIRLSHLAAHQAVRVGRASAQDHVWAYEDVEVLAMLMSDPNAARMFVQRELRGALGMTAKVVDLRTTVRLFLENGGSRVMTASALNLAATSVAYRVSRLSDLLGRPVADRPVETLLALQLLHRFPQLGTP